MRILWFVPLLLVGAGLMVRRWRTGDRGRHLTTDPVSADWLADARSRDDHPW